MKLKLIWKTSKTEIEVVTWISSHVKIWINKLDYHKTLLAYEKKYSFVASLYNSHEIKVHTLILYNKHNFLCTQRCKSLRSRTPIHFHMLFTGVTVEARKVEV